MYITRIAPSPTGLFHIGTARTAFFNWLCAKSTNGKFILRIDDTDLARNTKENIDLIYKSMAWLGLDFDETFFQSDMHKTGVYKDALSYLSSHNLASQGEEGEWRLKPNYDDLPPFWFDRIAGRIKLTEQDENGIHNLVLVRSDGMPTYNFATVVDDIQSNINLIIRGTDHIPNTPKQIVVRLSLERAGYKAMDVEHCHVGLITIGHEKMSKRKPEHAAAASIQTYIDKGVDPEAMLNFLLRMGWGPKNEGKERAVITRQQALDTFLEFGNMKSNAAQLDLLKLDSYDRKYKAASKRNERELCAA